MVADANPRCASDPRVDLEMGTRRVERRHAAVGGPLEEPAKVGAIRLQRAAAVAGEERGCGELSLINQRHLGQQHGRRRRDRLEDGHDQPPQVVKVHPPSNRGLLELGGC